jgi:hypothetical protein
LFENYVPPALFVTWQDSASRTIFPVGRLARVAGPESGYEFVYLRAARDAEAKGFTPFATFPDLNQVYRSRELPPFFQNRVMPHARPEFASHVSELGLDRNATPEAILARTNGRRATDPYEVFAEFEPAAVPGQWETRFFARSLRYLGFPEAIDKLAPGERLFCMRDVQNPADPKALALRTEKAEALVGFCPAYLVDELGPVLDEPDAVLVTVERLNPAPAPLQHRLQCHVRVRPRENFHSYRGGRFEPLSASALQLARWARVAEVA